MSKGFSIIICCYNSSNLLKQTLKYICNLKTPYGISWEVIIVDNGSKDQTSDTARRLLEEYNCPVLYRLLNQPVQGLTAARRMGLENSEYEYIIFCDDDNWLNEDFLNTGFSIMESNTSIGVLGGTIEAVTDGAFPEWFWKFKHSYSVGKQAEISGDITWTVGSLWGAGMIIRKYALMELFSNGYRSFLTDRKGDLLTSGGDIELCYALRLAGWKIWFDNSLKLEHFIPAEKLNWKYLRNLNRGFGAQKVDFDAYLKAFDPEPKNLNESFKLKWHYQSFKLLKKIRGYGLKKLFKFKNENTGDPEILRIEKTIGRLNELLKIKGEYNKRIDLIKRASWRKIFTREQI